jgi:hypothetical protein
MTPPIRRGDGTPVAPQGIAQVRRGDGEVYFERNVIPDSEDLYARYDARELSANDGDDITTWPDETGNNRDLTAGTAPSYNASGINGNPCVRFERSNSEYLSVDWTDLSQPLSAFCVFQQVTTDDFDYLFDGYSSDNVALENNGSGNYRVFAGNSFDAGSNDTNNHVGSVIYDGASSDFRIDGSNVFTNENPGSNAMDGLTIGMAGNGDKQPADLNTMIMLVYQGDKTSKVNEIEAYLSDQSGVTV